MEIYVDASTLIALGTQGELDLLSVFDGRLVVAAPVLEEVTTEPARTNGARFRDREDVQLRTRAELRGTDAALDVLGEDEPSGDAYLVGEVLWSTAENPDAEVGIVSDDRRVRRVARGLGGTVTGTVGVVVRCVEVDELPGEEAEALVRRIDDDGLHMTGELREKAYELIEDAS